MNKYLLIKMLGLYLDIFIPGHMLQHVKYSMWTLQKLLQRLIRNDVFLDKKWKHNNNQTNKANST